ncbi:hypothetical protein Fmac_026336 [Flemingia macrophylla]|uniref:Uncharacterized protein n=1 Tax=Flemingia macrophylla TaxID=520843 RepID=A0ABD1LEK0_9FABA
MTVFWAATDCDSTGEASRGGSSTKTGTLNQSRKGGEGEVLRGDGEGGDGEPDDDNGAARRHCQ